MILRSIKKVVSAVLGALHLRTPARKIWAMLRGRPFIDLDASPQQIFTEIYRTNYWGSEESRSGTGSTLERTDTVRAELEELFRELGVKTVLDAACGDFAWMREMKLEESDVSYTGVDIVPDLIARNNEQYGASNVRFEVRNLINDPLPAADLVICRDCLVHLSNDHVFKALTNIAKSGSRYLLTTSFRLTTKNKSIETGDWRPLNLLASPFDVGEPVTVLEERDVEDGFDGSKTLVLLDLAQMRTRFATNRPAGAA